MPKKLLTNLILQKKIVLDLFFFIFFVLLFFYLPEHNTKILIFVSIFFNYYVIRSYIVKISTKQIEFPLFHIACFFFFLFYTSSIVYVLSIEGNIAFNFDKNDFLKELPYLILLNSLFIFLITFFYDKKDIVTLNLDNFKYNNANISFYLNFLISLYLILYLFEPFFLIKPFSQLNQFLSNFIFSIIFYFFLTKEKINLFYKIVFILIFLNIFFSTFITQILILVILLNSIYFVIKNKISYLLIIISFFIIFSQQYLKYFLRESNITSDYLKIQIQIKIKKKIHLNDRQYKINYFDNNINLGAINNKELLNPNMILPNVSGRVIYPIITYVKVSNISEYNFKFENTYRYLLYSFVPRFIWKTKPENKSANNFARAYKFVNNNDFATSINIPIITEAKMNIQSHFFILVFFVYMIFLFIINKLISKNLKTNFFLK